MPVNAMGLGLGGGVAGISQEVQDALNAKQPLDGDLTAIAALTGVGFLKRTGLNTWVLGDALLYFTEASSTTTPYSATDGMASLTAKNIGSIRTSIQINPPGDGAFIIGSTPASLPAVGSRVLGLSSQAGQYATSIGRSSNSSGSDSCTIGFSSSAPGPYSVALGAESVANALHSITASRATANGREGSLSLGHSSGNHHQGNWITHGREINPAGTFDLTANGGAANTANIILLRNLSLNKIIGDVVAYSPTGASASWSIHEVWERNGSTYTRKYNGSVLNFADAGATTWTMTVVSDVTNNGIKVQVSSNENGTLVTGFIKLVEVY